MKQYEIKIVYVDVGNHNQLGIVDRICRTVRNLNNKYYNIKIYSILSTNFKYKYKYTVQVCHILFTKCASHVTRINRWKPVMLLYATLAVSQEGVQTWCEQKY